MMRWVFNLIFAAWLAVSSVAGAAELKAANGARAPALALKELNGTAHDLAHYRGKVVLVNFWATWCEPCRDEMPSIQRLHDKLAGQPFAVLAVNLDEPESRIIAFLEKTKLDLTVVLDPGKTAAKAWNARILPASYIVGRDGRVRYSVVSDIDWSDAHVLKIIADLMREK